MHDWIEGFAASITVCDRDGVIVAMNEAACNTFAKYGGAKLIGQSLFGCHPEPARSKLAELLQTGATNAYTIEKAGARKLIYQSPWFHEGKLAGLVELSLVLPAEMPHFVRPS